MFFERLLIIAAINILGECISKKIFNNRQPYYIGYVFGGIAAIICYVN